MDATAKGGDGILSPEIQNDPVIDQQERPANLPLARKIVRRSNLPQLPTYWTIGQAEKINLLHALKRPLSGYIGGNSQAGYWCTRLADEWSATFGCRYAIPCNSATSGLLAACLAADIGEGDLVLVSSYTMSATATCAMILGAEVRFMDIDPDFFTADDSLLGKRPKAIILTNLFGCAAYLRDVREWCDNRDIILIEDNAQAPFATENGKYTGTIGHMGVFSLNVHKHIQAGEGGVIVTDDPHLAHRLDCAINHGELMRSDPNTGLNLRMTEPIAAIASAQLKKGNALVQGRISLAHKISAMFKDIPFVQCPQERAGCTHVYYLWAGKITGDNAARTREAFLGALQRRNVPFRAGYSKPLHRIFWSSDMDEQFPVVREMEDERLFSFEVCAYDPKWHHLQMMEDIIHEEANKLVRHPL